MSTKLRHLSLAAFLVAFVGCATSGPRSDWRQGTTTINVTGTPNSQITGFYVQNREHHPIEGTLPFTLIETGVSEVEIRKVNPTATFTLETRCEDSERHLSFANMTAAPGVPGVRVQLHKGFTVETLRK